MFRSGRTRRIFLYLISTIVLAVLSTVLVYEIVSKGTEHYNSADLTDVPKSKVALVLGTSKYLGNGNPNLYFSYRIRAAVELFEAGKVSYILVSGDNSQSNYNEPRRMLQALKEAGIPADKIVLDYAGFRTLDSVVRAQKVFGQQGFIIVSQQFHNQRAVYIAKHFGLDVFGYNAQDVSQYAGLKTKVREYLARVKMMLDLYILGTQPKFLGEPVHIP